MDEITLYVEPLYMTLRRQNYPPLGELADALVKKENGDSTQYNEYIVACNAVKAKYPKPV